ncbi:unnamed protein product [Danaus chrysippus]|uniref:(African queen) hypothetical protein n=1 Tax=Danaus chrysippus TaxID=151541 RepID=A0A8J2QYD2_9NEOP|nr:unnamed protein product [Danaus chrysippus]
MWVYQEMVNEGEFDDFPSSGVHAFAPPEWVPTIEVSTDNAAGFGVVAEKVRGRELGEPEECGLGFGQYARPDPLIESSRELEDFQPFHGPDLDTLTRIRLRH